ncbi:unnamed protein product [Acanthoscelides obtectus]|uniref:AAA+ ATPase domain-containing protein n=1 Tax=Acanthoscelides obtectus TaxID=200917 RepID=A0A9P0K9M7_ACAOB|nr:unnamed protein product [Acanthoscelides obtectus]CAK1631093.1 Nuclear valosin-containing protein-like [Acanthoscelides obtectus]
MKIRKMPYISDPTIVPRIKKYLENNKSKGFINVNDMADELQRTYRDYANRKRSAFRASVNKAYSVVLEQYGLSSDNSEEESVISADSGEEEPTTSEQINDSMNNQMVDLYKMNAAKDIDENELIDISSEDSDDEEAMRAAINAHAASVLREEMIRSAAAQAAPPENNKAQAAANERYLAELKKDQNPSDKGKKRKLNEYVSVTSSSMKSNTSKKKKQNAAFEEIKYSFKDVGGMNKTLEEVCKLLLHITHPEIYKSIGITPPRGFLLHGPPGSGKTLLANAIAGELNVPLLKVAAPELVAGISGESEERIRELFDQSVKLSPCILFIDEIDAITPNRQNAQKDMEKRIVAQLLSCLDELSSSEPGNRVLVIGATNRPDSIDPALRRAGRFDREIPLGIPNKDSRIQILKVLTNKLKLMDGFDFEKVAAYTPGFVGADLLSLVREAAMAAVNRLIKEVREKYVQSAQVQQQQTKQDEKPQEEISAQIVVDEVPKEAEAVNGEKPTEPTLAADGGGSESAAVVVIDDDNSSQQKINDVTVTPVVSSVANNALAKLSEVRTALEEILLWLHESLPISERELQGLSISLADFEVALKSVQPSAKREGFATVPDITWDDVGALREIREELQMTIVAPVRHAKQFEALGLNVPTGVLLCGPPGCGKTLLAKAIANEARINFISVKGPELLNMYVGESERAVRVCFERARNSAPCVIFFDELDALCPKRSLASEGNATVRVVNQLLTEMDGIGSRNGVFLLAASNRPDIVDPAVLRPGRLDKILYVGLPAGNERVDILRTITKNGTRPKLAPDVDLEEIGTSEECRGFTGADLAALVREAGVLALKDVLCGETMSGSEIMVTGEHFKNAFKKIRPSVPEKDRTHYEKLRKLYSSLQRDTEVEEMELS